MIDVLVSLSTLRAHDDEIRRATDAAVAQLDVDPAWEMCLRYYLVFHEHLEHQVGLGDLDPIIELYNCYYWFKRFAHARAAHRGFDAGLDQQAFRLLETAPEGVDYELVRELDTLAAT
jgi:hypothetical protein